MSELLFTVALTALAGACIPLGGLLATIEVIHPNWLKNEFRHFLIALGGGILLGAVMLMMVPEGIKSMGHNLWAVLVVLLGGFCFFAIEKTLGLHQRQSPQFMGMILDYVPEALAIGGLAAKGAAVVPVLTLLIGLQNLPEGFNAFRELREQNKSTLKTLIVMLLLVPLGPLVAVVGYYTLGDYPAVLGAIMLFASGGILYLIFQDIAPQSKLDKHWGPPLGAVFGFCIALLGETMIRFH